MSNPITVAMVLLCVMFGILIGGLLRLKPINKPKQETVLINDVKGKE